MDVVAEIVLPVTFAMAMIAGIYFGRNYDIQGDTERDIEKEKERNAEIKERLRVGGDKCRKKSRVRKNHMNKYISKKTRIKLFR